MSTNPVSVFCRFAPILDNGNNNSNSDLTPEAIHVAVDGEAPSCTVTAADLRSCSWVQIGCTDVIDPSWQQRAVFDSVALPILERLIAAEHRNVQGIHHAVCAYGPTFCGKTYTTFGPHGATQLAQEDPETLGLVPRALEYLFAKQQQQGGDGGASAIEVSCVEIYNETAHDLVAVLRGGDFATNSSYKATEKMRVLRSLQRARCESFAAALELMKRLLTLRRTSATVNNDTSSRSHIVLRVTLPRSGNSLTFADLAGSESLRLATATNTTAESKFETKNINASLLALKKVVRALRKPASSSSHVPFKDSMLTAVLEPCFHCAVTSCPSASPDSKHLAPLQIVVCCSGQQRDSSETLATLRFAAEASAIRPVGMLNPLTMSALNEQQQSQMQQVQNKRHSSSTLTTPASSRSASAASTTSTRRPGQQHQQQQHQQGFAQDEAAESRSTSMNSSTTLNHTAAPHGTSANNSRCASAFEQQDEERGGMSAESLDSMKRIMSALVDENASLRTQIASQRQEIDESSSKASLLMEKSVQLLERFEALNNEVLFLRQENAALKNGGGGGSFFQQQPQQQQQQQQQASSSSCETPPPAGVRLMPAMIASPSTSARDPKAFVASQQQQQQQRAPLMQQQENATTFSV